MASVTPAESGRRSLPIWPLAVAGLGVGGLALVAGRDPATSGGYLRCPFHAATGLWCPGCGVTRGLHMALHGDVLGALGSNLFLPVFVILAVGAWATWLAASMDRRPPAVIGRVPTAAWIGLGAALLVFAVVRNLPFAATRALAP
jgi:hypothetical protein